MVIGVLWGIIRALQWRALEKRWPPWFDDSGMRISNGGEDREGTRRFSEARIPGSFPMTPAHAFRFRCMWADDSPPRRKPDRRLLISSSKSQHDVIPPQDAGDSTSGNTAATRIPSSSLGPVQCHIACPRALPSDNTCTKTSTSADGENIAQPAACCMLVIGVLSGWPAALARASASDDSCRAMRVWVVSKKRYLAAGLAIVC